MMAGRYVTLLCVLLWYSLLILFFGSIFQVLSIPRRVARSVKQSIKQFIDNVFSTPLLNPFPFGPPILVEGLLHSFLSLSDFCFIHRLWHLLSLSPTGPSTSLSGELRAFVHEPLDIGTAQIRLLRLARGRDQKWHAHIENFNFDQECPPYRAVSYMWGPPSPARDIDLNGQSFRVRQNLWLFMNATWSMADFRKGYFWIDQICIAQSNHAERNHQVEIMGEIYRRAQGVLIWTGPEDDDNYRQELKTLPLSKYTLALDTKSRWIWSLCWKPYWRRLWIIQEVILGRNLVIMSGDEKMPWDEFVKIILQGPPGGRSKLFPTDEFVPKVVLAIITERENYQQSSTLRKLRPSLEHFIRSECEDPRDKVYGLLGLVDETKTVSVDYQKSIEEVYIDVVQAVARQSDLVVDPVKADLEFCIALREALDLTTKFSFVEVARLLYANRSHHGQMGST